MDHAPERTVAGLDAMQRAHGRTFGFENLDVRLGRPIRIDSDSVFEKFIGRGRGGYCFEQNRLFSDALTAMGVPNRPLLARGLLNLPEGEVPPITHVCLLAEIEGAEWLIDAGFGGLYIAPMLVRDGFISRSGHRLRRITAADGLPEEWMLEITLAPPGPDGSQAQWQRQYSFDLREVVQADLEQASHWTSTRPDTRFTTGHFATISVEGGFASMTDRQLSIYRNGEREVRQIDDPAEYGQLLREVFQIALPDEEVRRLPLFCDS